MAENKKCLGCGRMFDVSGLCRGLKEKRNYCATKCYYERAKLQIKKDVKCENCDKAFILKGHMPPPNYKARRFCGRSCSASFQWDRHRDDFEDLFWSKVKKEGADACWPWGGNSFDRRNYGRINYKGKLIASHRMAYQLTNGNIPAGMYILHSCDNPPCCNPGHLRTGTHLENMADMTKRCRRPGLHRDINPRSKVTAAEKIIIIAEHDKLPRDGSRVKKGEVVKLAMKHGVSAALIRDLVRHRDV